MRLANSEIRFEVTNKCNAKCIMCPREKMKRPQGVLDMELYKRVLDDAAKAGALTVSLENYGESFMDPHIFERARYAKSKGLKTFTITNASLLDEEKAQLICGFFDKIRISMYGTTKDTYEKIHVGLSFERVKSNVENLFAIRDQLNSPLRIEIYFLLMDENKDQMDEFIKLYEKRADALSVWRPHNWGDGRIYRKPTGKKKISCGRPMVGPVQIQWDGKVVPCCFDYDSAIILGDLNTQSLHEVLHGDEYERLRAAHRSGDFSAFPFCNVCDQLNKREDVLVYTTIKDCMVGATNTTYFDLKKKDDRAGCKEYCL